MKPCNVSWLCSLAYVVLMLGFAFLSKKWAVLVYSLSYWHYYLYGLAYYYGAVELHHLKRDAMTMKAVSLLALGSVYLTAPFSSTSLIVVAAGFLLNAYAAGVLGMDRTYYGYELACVPQQHITDFPFSWISHPMLVGNMAAFGGTLINDQFRRDWWPLAGIHVAMNLGLLLMELYLSPQRQRAHGAEADSTSVRLLGTTGCIVTTMAAGMSAAAFCVFGKGTLTFLAAGIGATVGLYAYILHGCYSRPAPADPQEGN